MPQMSPLAWLSLMIMFTLSLILINSIMYFNKKYYTKSDNKFKNNKIMNWQW